MEERGIRNMRANRRFMILLSVLLLTSLLTACRVGEERHELTNYIGKTVQVFEKRAGIGLEEQGTAVYAAANVVQVMAPNEKISAITLLAGAGEYKLYGVGIGMKKEEVKELLAENFGQEITESINSEKNAVTSTYLKSDKELYVSYDIDKETVKEISFYQVDIKEKEKEEAEEQTNSGELMVMVGNTRVYYNEVMVYLKSVQQNYESAYGNQIWSADILGNGENFGDMVKDEVMNQITELKIIRAEAAKQDIYLSEEELAEANAYAKEHFEGLSAADIDKYLITEELLRQVYADNLLAEKMFEYLTINVDTEVSDQDSKQITVQHILIYNSDYDSEGKKIDLSTEEKAEAYEKVKNLLEQARTTEDFYALAEANSEADTIEYTFGRGEGPKEYNALFEQAAFTLRTGQVSDIITTDYGWHILYCISDYNEDATTRRKEAIISQRRSELFANQYAQWSAGYDVVVNSEAWNALSYEK